jgi:hypothetical protein
MSALADPAREAEFWDGVRYAGRFFMGDADVHRALVSLRATLEEAGTTRTLPPDRESSRTY